MPIDTKKARRKATPIPGLPLPIEADGSLGSAADRAAIAGSIWREDTTPPAPSAVPGSPNGSYIGLAFGRAGLHF